MSDVMSYFNLNWHGIKNEWTFAKNSSLTKLFIDLTICLSSVSSEKNLNAIKSWTRIHYKRSHPILNNSVETASTHVPSATTFVQYKSVSETDKFRVFIFIINKRLVGVWIIITK